MDEGPGVDEGERVECPSCGRRFNERAYTVHQRVSGGVGSLHVGVGCAY
jgi:hypothetical protein